MTNFISIFPLQIVLYPGEALNLHIFEPRYKQLIQECIAEEKPFGIPVARGTQPLEKGTLVRVTEVVKTYPDGQMDIRTKGEKVFEILTVVKEIPDKLYCGAVVSYPENVLEHAESRVGELIFKEVERLYALMQVEEKLPRKSDKLTSYDIGHLVGLSYEQEYELLGIYDETQRLEFLRRHLKEIAPVVSNLELLKERVKRNGHFRDLKWDGLF
ncbi:MAG: peptidase S16 [Sphingobacteriales bacterium]|nr:MAG: peptidase S16 [Sphingobacteriales bacterium]